MKSLLRYAPLVLVLSGLLFPACDLATVPPAEAEPHVANHLVINEVFTLPASEVNPFSWVELFNPTGDRIVGLNQWTLEYSSRLVGPGFDTSFTVAGKLISIAGAIPDTLEPGQFLVLISDSIRFYVHTLLGPGKGTATTYIPPFGGGGGAFLSAGGFCSRRHRSWSYVTRQGWP